VAQALTAAATLLAAFSPYRTTHHQAWNPETKKTITVEGGATVENALAHLHGTVGLGLSPLLDGGLVRWGVLDIDELEERMVGLAELERRRAAADSPLVLARTKSGDAHLYLFFHQPIPANEAREVLRGQVKRLGLDQLPGPDIEIFPKSASPGPKGSAAHINLPYFGALGESGTTRFAFTPNGKRASLDEFIDLTKQRRTIADGLEHVPEPTRFSTHDIQIDPGDQLASWNDIRMIVSLMWSQTNGKKVHHRLAVGVGGLLAKAGMTIVEAESVMASACNAAGDTDVQDRLRAIRDSFGAGRKAAGFTLVSELAGPALAKDLGDALDRWKDACGHGYNASKGNDWVGASHPKTNGKHPQTPSPSPTLTAPPTPAGPTDTTPVTDPKASSRRPAVDVIRSWALGDNTKPGPSLQYRDGDKLYASQWGVLLTSNAFLEHYSLSIRELLLAEANELEYVALHGLEPQKDKAARQVWNGWAKPAFRAAMLEVPVRGEIDVENREEHARLKEEVIKALSKALPVNEPGEATYHESVLTSARTTDSTTWTPVGDRGAFVRRVCNGFEIAIRYDFLLEVTPGFAAGIGSRKRFAVLCQRSGVAKSTSIRVGSGLNSGITRALVLETSFLRRLYHMPTQNVPSVGEVVENGDTMLDSGEV
jgi:hypothetical protein